MRRAAAYLLAAVMMLSVSGCAQREPESTVAFYYQRRDILYGSSSSVITYELREMGKYKKDLTRLLELYLTGPSAPELKNVFPDGCKLVSVSVSEESAKICLDSTFGELKGMKLTIACACLTKTVMALTGTGSVHIRAEDTLLAGAQQIVMNEENVLMFDQSAISPTQP